MVVGVRRSPETMTSGDSNARKKVDQGGFSEPGGLVFRTEFHAWLKNKTRPGDMKDSPVEG